MAGKKKTDAPSAPATTAASAPVTSTQPPVGVEKDKESSHNVALTGRHDETVEGGRYIGVDKKARNAHGELL